MNRFQALRHIEAYMVLAPHWYTLIGTEQSMYFASTTLTTTNWHRIEYIHC